MNEGTRILGVPRLPGPPRPPLSEHARAEAQRLMARYPEPRSALLPMLYLVQADHGFVSREGVREIAQMLGLTPAEVTAVATFYTMYKREPMGRWLVSVCTQPPCALRGANQIRDAIQQECGIGNGGTTEDGMISIEEVECLCICDGAPVVGINYENYENLTPESAVELIRALRAGETPPKPARGDVPAPHDETHRELAGLNQKDREEAGA
ncbi:MAG TPA: NAD(P)H-dependent oxidoreductase subunit E [Actinomycetota bacterium]|nr:NAD(P)H-dependent oxidoreductase subunit E [Actinomycetota bacterium]